MTEPLTDAELDVLSGDIHRPSSHQVFCKGCGAEWPCLESLVVAELRELRQQNVALRADVARALGWDSAEQWRAAMAQIDVGQKAIDALAAADASASSGQDGKAQQADMRW